MDIIAVEGLVKRYGELLALDHFDLNVSRGEIFGLLGPNGSGKTTSINCMLALLTYDRGSIELFGETMGPTRYDLKRRIGIVPQQVAVIDELTVRENIDYFCSLYMDDRTRRRALVDEAIEFVGLEEFCRFRPGKLSGGLLRRLNIACGIAHKPELIFFDEPTVAVDPQSRNAILTGILARRREFAVLQSIGMTGRQLKGMLIWEGVFYALSAVVFGAGLVLAMAPLMGSVETLLWFFTYHLTLVPVGILAPIFLLLGCLIPLGVYRSATRASLVERLQATED